MEHKAPESDKEVPIVADLKDLIVAVLTTALYTLPGTIPKHEVRQGVYDLCRVVGGIIILSLFEPSISKLLILYTSSHHCNVEVTGDQKPV